MFMPAIDHEKKVKPREPIAIALGEALAAARTVAGLTQEKAAEILAVTKQTISSWENGRNIPSTLVLMRLCQLYKSSADDVFNNARKLVKDVYRRPPKDEKKK